MKEVVWKRWMFILSLSLFTLSLPIAYGGECVVDVDKYAVGAIMQLKGSGDKMCFNMDICGASSEREIRAGLVPCKSISLWKLEEYNVSGSLSKKALATGADVLPSNIIFMDAENPEVFEPSENGVIFAKRGGKFYIGGKDAAVVGDPYALNRMITEWWLWAGVIVILLLWLVVLPKVKKTWLDFKNKEDEEI